MATRRTNNRKVRQEYQEQEREPPRKKPVGVMFWLAFFILVTGLFFVNGDRIRETLESTQILSRLSLLFPGIRDAGAGEENRSAEDAPKAALAVPEAPGIIEVPKPAAPAREPLAQTPAKPAAAEPAAAGRQPAADAPSPPKAAAAAPVNVPSADRRPAVAERAIYFTQVDAAGTIIRTKVARSIPASDSPLVESLNALLAGPTGDEQRRYRGIRSFIPQGVKILSATVRDGTARINFSEEFQYNTFGVEGYAAQLRQIIWTATEFPTVKNVQILIDGRRIDYLGEGIWIGGPLSRDML